MKFRFKIQQYQTDAVDSVVRAFKGQPYSDGVSYRRDLGEVKPVLAPVDQQISLFPPDQISMDEVDDTGYLNEMLQLTDEQLVAAGIEPGMVRISVGLENVEDIIADLKQALDTLD